MSNFFYVSKISLDFMSKTVWFKSYNIRYDSRAGCPVCSRNRGGQSRAQTDSVKSGEVVKPARCWPDWPDAWPVWLLLPAISRWLCRQLRYGFHYYVDQTLRNIIQRIFVRRLNFYFSYDDFRKPDRSMVLNKIRQFFFFFFI